MCIRDRGKAELLDKAKAEVHALMAGESSYLARFAKAIDQFEDASASVLTSLMASVGVASDVIHLKKSGTFPIVHGVRVMALEQGIAATSTAERLDALAKKSVLSPALCNDLKSALAYFMEVRLRSQLRAIRTGRPEEEAIVHLQELSSRDRDLLREALKVVKRFKDVVRSRYHLAQL